MDDVRIAVVGIGATGTVLAAALLSRHPDTMCVPWKTNTVYAEPQFLSAERYFLNVAERWTAISITSASVIAAPFFCMRITVASNSPLFFFSSAPFRFNSKNGSFPEAFRFV